MGTKQETFIRLTKFLDSYLNHSTDTMCIDVFPLRCGIGKSTYITHKISEVLTNVNDGLIVVTDSVDVFLASGNDTAQGIAVSDIVFGTGMDDDISTPVQRSHDTW